MSEGKEGSGRTHPSGMVTVPICLAVREGGSWPCQSRGGKGGPTLLRIQT